MDQVLAQLQEKYQTYKFWANWIYFYLPIASVESYIHDITHYIPGFYDCLAHNIT